MASPILLSSAHSGRHYPADWCAASRLDALSLRRSEDAYVDELIGAQTLPQLSVLAARYARAYVDLNRDPAELDPALFHGSPSLSGPMTDRVRAGIGVIPRVVGIGMNIYSTRMPLAEAERRIAAVHEPYHAALHTLLARRRQRWGYAVLLDWHSMPSGAVADLGRQAPDIVLGDRRGQACDAALMDWLGSVFASHGLRVAVNTPYAGGYILEQHGRPQQGCHAVQIEINRRLYLDEIQVAKTSGFAPLQRAISAILARAVTVVPTLGLATGLLETAQIAAE